MEYAYLGRSNVQVSKVCLGTMHFGRRCDEKESFAIMDRALDMGINFWDTANVYGDPSGRSEEIIGRWFAQGGSRRDQVVLATKVYGGMNKPGPNEERGISDYKIRMHVAESLRRLQTDRIDLYQVHHIDRHISPEEFWGAFERLQLKGDILYVGTSNFPGWGLAKYQAAAWQRGNVGIVSEQSMYSLLCRYPELEVLPAAKEFGIGVIPYMPLAGGLLTGKTQSVEGSRTAQVEGEYGMRGATARSSATLAPSARSWAKPSPSSPSPGPSTRPPSPRPSSASAPSPTLRASTAPPPCTSTRPPSSASTRSSTSTRAAPSA